MKPDLRLRPGNGARPRSHAATYIFALLAVLLSISPGLAFACACGCGVFDIGSALLFPSGTGGIGYLDYDYMNQNRNWSGRSSAPSDNNTDKQIRTQFYTAGMNYMWNHTWGVMVRAAPGQYRWKCIHNVL